MSAYIQYLNEQVLSSAPHRSPDLQSRFLKWFNSQPEFTRQRAFSMGEIETALTSQGKYISPILLANGWRRMRRWNSRGQYHRYWTPPADDPLNELARPAANPPVLERGDSSVARVAPISR